LRRRWIQERIAIEDGGVLNATAMASGKARDSRTPSPCGDSLFNFRVIPLWKNKI
jgi:hypothetical protein